MTRFSKLAALVGILAAVMAVPALASATPTLVPNSYSCFIGATTGATIRALPPARMDPAPTSHVLGGLSYASGYVYWYAQLYTVNPATSAGSVYGWTTSWWRAISFPTIRGGGNFYNLQGYYWWAVLPGGGIGGPEAWVQWNNLPKGTYAVKEYATWDDGESVSFWANLSGTANSSQCVIS